MWLKLKDAVQPHPVVVVDVVERLKFKNAVQLQPHRTYIRRPAPAAAEGEHKAFE
jgi:hypothetical protein